MRSSPALPAFPAPPAPKSSLTDCNFVEASDEIDRNPRGLGGISRTHAQHRPAARTMRGIEFAGGIRDEQQTARRTAERGGNARATLRRNLRPDARIEEGVEKRRQIANR